MPKTSCDQILQKFLTGRLPEPQHQRLERWLEMMRNGAIRSSGLSKPEERIFFQYVSAGTSDIEDFKGIYEDPYRTRRRRRFKILLIMIMILSACYIASTFVFSMQQLKAI